MAQQAPYFSAASFFGMLSQKGKEAVLKEVADEMARRFDTYVHAIEEATGIKQLKGEDLRNAYAARDENTWQAIAERFPQEYERQLREWANLEKSAERKISVLYPARAQNTSVKSMGRGLKALELDAAKTTMYSPPVPLM